MEINQTDLVERVKRSRDMAAYRDLVFLHQRKIYYLIRKIVRNHEDSEDLMQETFIRALKNIDQLRQPDRFGSWLCSIAVNLAFLHRRRAAVNVTVPLDSAPDLEQKADPCAGSQTGTCPEDRLHTEEIRQRLNRALRNLPEKQQTAFELFHRHGMRVKEIAEIIDCTEINVRTLVFRAVKSLKVSLQPFYNSLRD
jgi:RNA polymerase sigma-70 factor, ECF subfamily